MGRNEREDKKRAALAAALVCAYELVGIAEDYLLLCSDLAFSRRRSGSTQKIIKALTMVPPAAKTTPSGWLIPWVE